MQRWLRSRWYKLIGALLVLCLAQACGSEVNTDPAGEAAGALVLQEASAVRVTGTFQRGGVALRFESGAGALRIVTADGRSLVEARQGGGGSLQLLEGRWSFRGDSGASAGGQPEAVLRSVEMAQLPWLSRALGARGVTGRDYPAAFPLHLLGQTVATALQIDVPALPEAQSAAESADVTIQCQDLRSNPNHDDCYGMCGRGCSCWSWVCGDCCRHPGCAYHDTQCRRCSWRNPLACDLCYVHFAQAFLAGGGC